MKMSRKIIEPGRLGTYLMPSAHTDYFIDSYYVIYGRSYDGCCKTRGLRAQRGSHTRLCLN